MRDKNKTIESLRRLAERPGTPNEGEIARRLLEQLGARFWKGRDFDPQIFATGVTVYYCYWCYRNERGVICKQPPKSIQGRWWLRIKFEHLKQPRWVAVTSQLGCHLSLTPFEGDEQETLYRMDLYWRENDRELARELRRNGWGMTPRLQRLLDELEGIVEHTDEEPVPERLGAA